MILLKLIIITLVNVLIIDLSGIINDIKSLIARLLTKSKLNTSDFRIKPFDCSLCMTFWTGLAYLLILNSFSLFNLLILLLLAYFTDVFRQLLLLLKDLFIKFINYTYGKFID